MIVNGQGIEIKLAFAVRREVVEALLRDKEWSRRLEEAKTTQEVVKVLGEFCKIKGFKVKRAKPQTIFMRD